MNAFRRYRHSLRAQSFSGLDLLIILMSYVIVHFFYLDGLDFTSERFILTVAILGTSYVAFAAVGLYRTQRLRSLHWVLNRLTFAWFLVITSVGLFAFLIKIAEDVSRFWFGVSTVLAYTCLVIARVGSSFFLVATQKRGTTGSSIFLIGHPERIEPLSERLRTDDWSGNMIVGTIELEPAEIENDPGNSALDKALDELADRVESERRNGSPVAEVWIALPLACEEIIRQISIRLRNSSVDVCVVPDAFAMQMVTGAVMNRSEMAIINISDIRLPGSAELFKRLFDMCVASLAIVVLSPILLAIAVAVRMESGGPILFRQHRYGMDGKEIEVWKFRSMTVEEDQGLVVQATRNDDRVTRIGAFLRRHSLDELPQFFNVLQGTMSIVGPRPHAVSHNEEYRGKIDGYMMRHKIKPGITGWAQVNGWRGETETLDKMEGRVRHDLEYIRNWSPGLDLKIILLTAAQVVSGRDAY